MKMKCTNCGYEWITKSDKIFVTCPSCLGKTKKEEGDGTNESKDV